MPLPHRGVEAERLNGNADLGGPPGVMKRRHSLPDPVPLSIDGFPAGFDDAVEPGAARVDGKDIAGTPIPEWTEHDSNVILLVERRVTSDAEADNVVRLRILARDADDQRVTARENAHRRPDRGNTAFERLDLRQGVRHGGRPPRVLVQVAIELHRLRPAPGGK